MQYLIFHDACLCLYLYMVSHLTADERLSHRRFIGDLAFQAVRLCGAYQFELHLFIKCLIIDLDGTSHVDLIKVYLVFNYNFCILQNTFLLFDSRLNISLLILCRFVIRIL